MNPWTSLLESLHSSLIDELTERQTDPKPELGMPIRSGSFALPSHEITSALVCRVSIQRELGIAGLAIVKEAAQALGLSSEQLWEKVWDRATREFKRRGIQPKLDARQIYQGNLPEDFPHPKRVIWIPISLVGGRCFLGVAA